MKNFISVSLLVVLFLALALPVLAQEPPVSPLPTPAVDGPPTYNPPSELPKTATEGLAEIGKIFAFVGAWLTYQLMKAINTAPGVDGQTKARWQGLSAAAVTAAISLLTDLALTYLGMLAGWLDKTGFWTVFLWGMLNIPAAWAMYQGGKFTGALPDLLNFLRNS